ncbi:MAG: leader peptidase (prepilin peptidase)/N-methyltransferase, partial [Bradymonadia bacterium]
ACGKGYSARYMVIEAICGVLILALFRAVVLESTAETFTKNLMLWGWFQTLIYGLVVITFIDLAETFIPEEVTIPLLIVGVCGPFFLSVPPLPHVWGALAGGGAILLIYAVGFLIFRREAMGLGDAMLLAVIGGFLGWRSLPFILFAAAVQTLIAVAVATLYSRVTGKQSGLTLTTEELDARFGEEERFAGAGSHLAVPFGPFLAIAALEALFFGHDLLWQLAEAIVG